MSPLVGVSWVWPNSGNTCEKIDFIISFSEALSQHSSIVLSDDAKCAIFYEESSSEEEEEEEEVGGDMYPLEDGERLASATAGEEEMWD